MGKSSNQSRSAGQREVRRRRGERAFLFEKSLSRCLAEFEREEWEWALSSCGGDAVQAARQCGLKDAPTGIKALWGRSADEARGAYQQWQRRRGRS